MAAITKIEFWSDVGFIDGAVEIPRLDALPPENPDVTIEPDDPIMPSKDRFFTELKLKEYYTGLLTMSYMRITYDLKNSMGIDTPNVYYGWIDKVDLSSDGDYPMTIVSWHIDEWRTWKSAVTFGSGHVKRRPFRDLDSTPIQDYQYRFLKKGGVNINLLPDSIKNGWVNPSREILWAIVAFNDTWTVSGYSIIDVWAIPLFRDGGKVYYGSNEYEALPWNEVLRGLTDERLGIPPSSIIGAWLSPIAPLMPLYNEVTGKGIQGDPFKIKATPNVGSSLFLRYGGHNADPNDPLKYFVIDIGSYRDLGFQVDIGQTITSTENERLQVVSLDGNKVMDLPYGYPIRYYTISFHITANEAFIQIAFGKDAYPNASENIAGLCCNIPLPQLPINENAWLEYTYSGQRDYDREARTIQSNSNAFKSTVSGGSTGALVGAFGPIGAAVGGAVGAAPGLMSYGVEMLYQNDQEQRILDRLKANQTASLLITSNGHQPFVENLGIRIRSLDFDDYSSGQVTATRNQFGVSVDELMSSCDSLIRSTSPTGYYNIQNMIVNGNIPVSAKKWIREKFRSGVRLI